MSTRTNLLTIPVLVMAASAAKAQSTQNNIHAAVGINYLLDSDARDATKATGFRAEVGYHLPNMGVESGPKLDYSIDLTWARNEDSGNRLDNMGLYLTGRSAFEGAGSTHVVGKSSTTPYWGLGVGIVRNEFRGTVQQGGSGGVVNADDSNYRFGARLILGVTFNNSFFVEGAYNYNGTLDGTRTDSLSAVVGIRF